MIRTQQNHAILLLYFYFKMGDWCYFNRLLACQSFAASSCWWLGGEINVAIGTVLKHKNLIKCNEHYRIMEGSEKSSHLPAWWPSQPPPQ